MVATNLTTGQIATMFGCQPHHVRRAIDRFLPTPIRIGPYRAIPATDLPKVQKALEDAGYVKGAAADELPPRHNPVTDSPATVPA